MVEGTNAAVSALLGLADRPTSVFAELASSDLRSLAEQATLVTYQPGETLYVQGTPTVGHHVVFQGWVKVVHRAPDGKTRLLGIASDQDGELIPPFPVDSQQTHMASAVALQSTREALIDRGAFRDWLEAHPDAAIQASKRAGDWFRYVVQELTQTDYYATVEQQLARKLSEAADRFGTVDDDGHTIIDVPLTRQDWADWVGHSREATTKLFRRWQRAGLVDFRDSEIRILRAGELRNLVPE